MQHWNGEAFKMTWLYEAQSYFRCLIPCFYILPLSGNAEVIYTQTIQLALWGVKKVCVDGGEVSSMPECGGGGGWVRDVLWKESILYRLSAWMAGYSSGTASHFLSNCSTCSICRQQNDDKKEKKKIDSQRLNRKHHTQSDDKKKKKNPRIQSEDPKLTVHPR